MSSLAVLLSIVLALSIGAMSPGPSFVVVSRIAVSRSRAAGIAAAMGMGIGGVTFAVLALLGLNALLMQVEWLYLALKIAGGLYLIYLGIRIWRAAPGKIDLDVNPVRAERGIAANVWFGLATQLSNPKTAIVYGSIFAALLPARPVEWLVLALPPAVFAIEAGWYTLVAIAFSASRPRSVYLRCKTTIDRLAGTIMGALGVRLVMESLPRHL